MHINNSTFLEEISNQKNLSDPLERLREAIRLRIPILEVLTNYLSLQPLGNYRIWQKTDSSHSSPMWRKLRLLQISEYINFDSRGIFSFSDTEPIDLAVGNEFWGLVFSDSGRETTKWVKIIIHLEEQITDSKIEIEALNFAEITKTVEDAIIIYDRLGYFVQRWSDGLAKKKKLANQAARLFLLQNLSLFNDPLRIIENGNKLVSIS